ncbi:MAG: glutamine synthetase family protein [Desulfobacterales bacterium]|nr:glutamine synthetase family protein [Desulfobacterales bacterium]
MDRTIGKKLEEAGVRFIRLLWCDNANVIRAKAGHISFLEDLTDNGIGITSAQMAIPAMYDAVVPGAGLDPVGEIRLMPDWSTLKVLPYAGGHAQVICDMIVPETGAVWDHCPRGFLKRQAEQLGKMGLTLNAVFENEFFLLKQNPDGAVVPADNTVYAATGSMNRHLGFIEEFTGSLIAQDIEVESYYPEAGPGQQEVNIRHAEALQAADRQVCYRETARGVACRHDYIASFLPKIYEDKAGSGCHINFSLWRDGKNISSDPGRADGLSRECAAFMAGILDRLPALCALTIPSKTSYRRIRPHFWAGAFRAWGTQNREAALRVCRDRAGRRADRVEYKTADATANPYLALGAIIAAGMDGIRRDLPLPEEVLVDPGLIPEKERSKRGIDLLPRNLGEAIDSLEKDDLLLPAMGKSLAQSFTAVRRHEWENLKDAGLEEEVELLLERY